MTCVGALATHYHPDHVGGDMMGWGIEGISRLLELTPVPVHVQSDEVPWVIRSTGVGEGDLVAHAGGFEIPDNGTEALGRGGGTLGRVVDRPHRPARR